MRAPMVIRWPGVIRPGTVKRRDLRFARLGANARQHRRRPEGRRTEEADRGRPVSGHRQNDTRWRRPDANILEGKSKVGARYVLLLFRQGPFGRPLQELEDVLRDGVRFTRRASSTAWFPIHWTQVVNIKRDPFETSIGSQYKKSLWLWAGRLRLPPPPMFMTGTCCPSARRCG